MTKTICDRCGDDCKKEDYSVVQIIFQSKTTSFELCGDCREIVSEELQPLSEVQKKILSER